MKNLTFANPVKVIFGAGEINSTGNEAKRLGKKAVIVTGKRSVKTSGLLDAVQNSLEKAGVGFVTYSYVTPNPKVNEVDEAAELAIAENCDMVIGLGGGSAMDAAKGVCVAAANKKSIWDFVYIPDKGAEKIEKALPLMLIPTLAATGSEGNPAAVFSNPETGQKQGLYNPEFLYPKVSIVDPLLTTTVPAKQTAEGIIDIIMHVLEEYLTGDENCALQDRITEGVMLTCVESGAKLMKDLKNPVLRADISLSSTVALMGVPNAGRAGNWAVHPIEHAISALHDEIAHGAGIAAVLPAYLQFLERLRPNRVIQFGQRVFGIPEDVDDKMKIPYTIDRLKAFMAEIGLKDNLKDLGIKQEELKTIADKVIEVAGVPAPIKDRKELEEILNNAY